MDKSFDGLLDAVTNGRFLLIGMQKTKTKKEWAGKRHDWKDHILLKYNLHVFFVFWLFFFATAGQCWLPRMLRSCNFSSAIFFPFRDETWKCLVPGSRALFMLHKGLEEGWSASVSLQELVPWNISFSGGRRKENVDLRHATNDT